MDQLSRVPGMARRKSVALALSLAAGLGLIACGGGDEGTSTQGAGSTSAQTGDATPGKTDAKPTPDHEPEVDARPGGPENGKQAADPQKAAGTPKAGRSKEGSSDESPHGNGNPHYASDEERCNHEPSTCGPDENATPDPSNPDVRRAEERAEEPDKPTKCDSSDCEEIRRGER
jgi:hypothetical protein